MNEQNIRTFLISFSYFSLHRFPLYLYVCMSHSLCFKNNHIGLIWRTSSIQCSIWFICALSHFIFHESLLLPFFYWAFGFWRWNHKATIMEHDSWIEKFSYGFLVKCKNVELFVDFYWILWAVEDFFFWNFVANKLDLFEIINFRHAHAGAWKKFI